MRDYALSWNNRDIFRMTLESKQMLIQEKPFTLVAAKYDMLNICLGV